MLTELNLRGKRLCKNGVHGVGKRGRREENTAARPILLKRLLRRPAQAMLNWEENTATVSL